MWIRNQDKKKLINANEVWAENGYIYASTTSTTIGWSGVFMGKYDVDRAIEILDAIQSQIFLQTVYQMPEE